MANEHFAAEARGRLTVEVVREGVAAVEAQAQAGNDAGAHAMEDGLHMEVLAAIAEGRCDDPAACAREALTTRRVSFERWYA